MRFPDQEGLVCPCSIIRFGRCKCSVFKARSEAGIDLIIPPTTDTPRCLAIGCHDFTTNLVSRRSLPPSRLKVQGAGFACCVILDFHSAIVVNSWVSCNDTNDGRRDLLPSVQFFAARRWAKFEKPGT